MISIKWQLLTPPSGDLFFCPVGIFLTSQPLPQLWRGAVSLSVGDIGNMCVWFYNCDKLFVNVEIRSSSLLAPIMRTFFSSSKFTFVKVEKYFIFIRSLRMSHLIHSDHTITKCIIISKSSQSPVGYHGLKCLFIG